VIEGQYGLAQVFVLAAIVGIVAHRWVSNRWLAEHHRRYRRLPTTDWWREQDRDPIVERWRRMRLLVLVPTVGAFATAVTLLITSR
jgi:hypothetical protein